MDQLDASSLIEKATEWIKNQREAYRPKGRELTPREGIALEPYFGKELLDRVRIVQVEHLENPPFYGDLLTSGRSGTLNFAAMPGLALIDCILLSKSMSPESEKWLSFLFHEMVHVAQYTILGVEEFAQQYVTGWIECQYYYWKIPLENEAFQLVQRFEEEHKPFSVMDILQEKHLT